MKIEVPRFFFSFKREGSRYCLSYRESGACCKDYPPLTEALECQTLLSLESTRCAWQIIQFFVLSYGHNKDEYGGKARDEGLDRDEGLGRDVDGDGDNGSVEDERRKGSR